MLTQPCSSPCSSRSSIGSPTMRNSIPGDRGSLTSVRSSRALLPDPRNRPPGAAPGLRGARLPRALPEGQVPAADHHNPDEGAVPAALVPEGEHSRARAPESGACERHAEAPAARTDRRPTEGAGSIVAALGDPAPSLHGGGRGAGRDAGGRQPPDGAEGGAGG